ncbi:MAG: 1-deoxy-D-xylulose-5-phosphate synthase [Desulfobacterales bacterium]|nr:1-deoxy-D-xylulose-5-phosphate synthase [Desulfobacterales bacterium]
MALLDKIQSPSDLKNIPQSELPRLAREIRQRIVDVVSKTGGHLASNLGMVELSIALHYVFDAPKDKIVWDVGHQSYTHKLLTGRKERFHTLRQHEGLSGFPRISESPYDAFSTGHSSTSISAGLGMVAAKRLKQEPHKVVSVIGDGSMTAGMAYEGLNQAGDLKKDLLVILNDNEMSISKNVGALSSLLSRTFSARYLQDLRKEVGEILRSLPGIGNDAYQFAKRAEESFKAFVTPGILFEAFNFDYFGPIKGHRLDQLIDMLENIKNIEDPVLLHVVTQKGRGYEPAEKNPVYFHGVGSFRVETGDRVAGRQSAPSYTQIFGQTMMALASADERLIAVTAAMPEGTGLVEFSREFPDRFFDVGIAEQHGVTFAAGMASEGLKPVVAIYSTFLQRAYDQLIHDVCLESLPVTFAVDRGGIVGEDGPTHHGLFDFSYLRALPNMVVMAPKDENELRRMLVTAVDYPGPIAFRYPRGAGLGVALEEPISPLPIGRGEVLTKGDDLLILAIGVTVNEAVSARKILAETYGLEATVVNCRFVKPVDTELLCDLAGKIPNILTVEENVCEGGFGSAVLEALHDAGIGNIRVKRLGVRNTFVEHGARDLLRAKYGIDAKGIVRAVAAWFAMKSSQTGS